MASSIPCNTVSRIREGAVLALLAADEDGWIHPPCEPFPAPSFAGADPRTKPFTSADLNVLRNLGLIGRERRRVDRMRVVQLSPAGEDARRRIEGRSIADAVKFLEGLR